MTRLAELELAYARALRAELKADRRHDAIGSARSLAAYAAASERTNAIIRERNALIEARDAAGSLVGRP